MAKKDPKEEFEGMLNGLGEDSSVTRHFFLIHRSFFVSLRYDDLEEKIDRSRRFWSFVINGLQNGIFSSLGRFFDTKGGYGLRRVINYALASPSIFRADHVTYLTRLCDEVEHYRDAYDRACAPIRNQVIAHSVHTNAEKKSELFSELCDDEIFRLVCFVKLLTDALRALYYKGEEHSLPFDIPEFPDEMSREGSIPFLDEWGLASETSSTLRTILTNS